MCQVPESTIASTIVDTVTKFVTALNDVSGRRAEEASIDMASVVYKSWIVASLPTDTMRRCLDPLFGVRACDSLADVLVVGLKSGVGVDVCSARDQYTCCQEQTSGAGDLLAVDRPSQVAKFELLLPTSVTILVNMNGDTVYADLHRPFEENLVVL